MDPLPDHGPLELSEYGEHLGHCLPGWSAGKKTSSWRRSWAANTTCRCPVADLAEQIVIEAMNGGGWGGGDSRITFRQQEEAAGVEGRAPAVDPGKAATFVSTHPEGDH